MQERFLRKRVWVKLAGLSLLRGWRCSLSVDQESNGSAGCSMTVAVSLTLNRIACHAASRQARRHNSVRCFRFQETNSDQLTVVRQVLLRLTAVASQAG